MRNGVFYSPGLNFNTSYYRQQRGTDDEDFNINYTVIPDMIGVLDLYRVTRNITGNYTCVANNAINGDATNFIASSDPVWIEVLGMSCCCVINDICIASG